MAEKSVLMRHQDFVQDRLPTLAAPAPSPLAKPLPSGEAADIELLLAIRHCGTIRETCTKILNSRVLTRKYFNLLILFKSRNIGLLPVLHPASGKRRDGGISQSPLPLPIPAPLLRISFSEINFVYLYIYCIHWTEEWNC